MPDAPVIVADDAIGWVREAFGSLGTLRLRPGAAIVRADLRDADALAVRTVTRVDHALVHDTPVTFVGSATAGEDHIDRAALQAAGITVAHAPGCNATAVAQYVLAAMGEAAHRRGRAWLHEPIGVIGFGACGRRLTAALRALGADVRVCDPFLATMRDAPHEPDPHLRALVPAEHYRDLEDVLASCRTISLHVPRTAGGPWPTLGMIDANALQRLPDRALVINTSRGGVVDDGALAPWIDAGRGDAVLDVWADEPSPDPALVDRVLVATPHVAGYSIEGKLEATRRVADALARRFGVPHRFDPAAILGPLAQRVLDLPPSGPTLAIVAAALRQAIDPAADDAMLRAALARAGPDRTARAAAFERLRRGYAFRRELAAFALRGASTPPDATRMLTALGMGVLGD